MDRGLFHNKKVVIWDMDGTLLNTLEDITAALNGELRAHGLPEHTPQETLAGIGHGARFLCQWGSGLQGDALERFVVSYHARAASLDNTHTHPFEGIPQALRLLSARGIRHAIYTNKPQKWTEILVQQFFDDIAFDVILGAGGGDILKPSAQGIACICQKLGVSVGDVVMVGDSMVDVETARNAQCDCVCFTWGFGRREELKASGVHLLNSAPALVAMFD